VRAFVPPPLPRTRLSILVDYYQHLDRANQASTVGWLDDTPAGYRLFLLPLCTQRSPSVSQIEGTKSSFSDLLLFENEASPRCSHRRR